MCGGTDGRAINIHVDHARPPDRQQTFGRNLLIAIAASGLIFLIEVWGSIRTGSLGLLADAGHALTDLTGLLLSYFALRLASRPATVRATFGFERAEVLAAGLNGFLLAGITVFLVVRAVERLQNPRAGLDGALIMAVAGAAAAVNIGAALLLHKDAHRNINAKGAYWNVVGDALASIAVLVSGLLVRMTGDSLWDTLVTFLVAAIIAYGAWLLLRQTTGILLETSPPHVDLADLKNAVEELDGVINVHDLHVWTLTPGRYSASLHVSIQIAHVPTFHHVIHAIEDVLEVRFGLTHCTIQVEPEGDHVSDVYDPLEQRPKPGA